MDEDQRTYTEQEVLDVLIRLDRLGQEHYSKSLNPLAGTGAGDLNRAIGLREASDMLRMLLRMPRHGGFRREPKQYGSPRPTS